MFGQGEAGAGTGLDGVGFLVTVDGDAIVLVALGVAAGEAELGLVQAQPLEESEEVVGVGAGGIEADLEVNLAVPAGEIGETLTQARVALGRFGDFQVGGGRLEVGVEEGDVVAVTRGVDADANGRDGWSWGRR
jgi:hypothetical protein